MGVEATDRRVGIDAGSAVARHPAGGSAPPDECCAVRRSVSRPRTTVGAPARRSTCHASWRGMDERHNLLDIFERMF